MTEQFRKPLVVRDIFHGDMVFDFPIGLIIDHSYFQRLKYIVQNGTCYQVFPGMTHTRFQHSLGVAQIANKWFKNLTDNKQIQKTIEEIKTLRGEMPADLNCSLDFQKTFDTYKEIIDSHKEKWEFLVTSAALCHDLGHGPFSHLLEEAKFIPTNLFIAQAKESIGDEGLSATIEKFLVEKYSEENERVDHEDLTLVYLSKIFIDLEEKDERFNTDNLHIACSLISKEFKHFYIAENLNLAEYDKNAINLFICLTSGFIDADRLDYVLRDSKMAGVDIGGIEINKVIKSLVPALFIVDGDIKGGFISPYKYHHILDNFFFTLYQVYTNVIFHPKALQLNHSIIKLLEVYRSYLQTTWKNENSKEFNFIDWHIESNDTLFIKELSHQNFDAKSPQIINKILNRHEDYYNSVDTKKSVYGLPDTKILNELMTSKGFEAPHPNKRDMLKDSSLLVLFSRIEGDFHFHKWSDISVICQKLKGHSFKSSIHCHSKVLNDDLDGLKEAHSLPVAKKTGTDL